MIFFTELYKYSRSKLIYCLGLMMITSLFDGVGLLILLPLLELMNKGAQGVRYEWAYKIANTFGFNFSLPLILILYILIGSISAILSRKQSILSINIQQGFANHLSICLFSAILNANWQGIISKSKANFSNSLTSELQRVTTGTAVFLQLLASGLVILIQLALSIYVAPKLTLFVFIFAVIIFGFFYCFTCDAKKIGTHLLHANQKLMFQITEYLNGIKEIKSYGLQNQELLKFRQLRESVTTDIIQSTVIQARVTFLYKIIALLMISAVFFVAVQIYHTPLTTLVVLLFIFAKIWPRITSISNLLTYIIGILPAFSSIMDLERQLREERDGSKQSVIDSANTIAIKKITLQPQIEFKHVFFRHQSMEKGCYNLSDISFSVPFGSTTAIVGISGAGKSTLADLLIGLIVPDKGSIMIDNQNLSSNLQAWRQNIAYVPQDTFIFNDSIKNNLIWSAPSASESDIAEVLDIASMANFVNRLPDGINTLVGDSGVTLSGGEKQRLVLARALLRRPSVLILDEATSSLDNYNEQVIRNAIDSYHGKITICVIAHRLSTIVNADQIIVLNEGRIVETGTYQSLVADVHSHFRFMQRAGVK